MLKTVGKIVFLLVSVAIVCALFWVGWKDATRHTVEMPSPAEQRVEATQASKETVPVTETTTEAIPEKDAGVVTSEMATSQPSSSEAVKESTTAETEKIFIETMQWIEDENDTSPNTTEASKPES